jgi:rhomboid protease GluP
MKRFIAMESMALELYSLPQTTPKDSIMLEIKDRGIYYWNEDLELVKNVDELTLPEHAHKRDKKLIDYCNLRLKVYKLMYKTIEENTSKYQDSIIFYNTNIKMVLDSLNRN